MRIILQNVILPFGAEDEEIIEAAADKMRRLGVNTRTLHFELYKKSFDARKKQDIKSVSSVLVDFGENKVSKRLLDKLLERSGAVLLKDNATTV